MRSKAWIAGVAIALIPFCCVLAIVPAVLRGCTREHSRPVGDGNVTFDVSRDGSKVVFAANGQGGRDLYLLDRTSSKVVALTQSPDYEISPEFSPDGKRVVFTRAKTGIRADQLCVMDLESRHIAQLTDADENISSPTFSADGRSVIYTLETKYRWGGLASSWNEAGQLTRLNLLTKKRTVLVSESRMASDPDVSKDGMLLAWAESRGVYVAPLVQPGSSKFLASHGSSPSFSPDGKFVAIVTGTYVPDYHVEIISLAGGSPSPVPHTEGAMSVRFHPNGRLLVLREFWREGGFGTPSRGLWEVCVDGTNSREALSEARVAHPLDGAN